LRIEKQTKKFKILQILSLFNRNINFELKQSWACGLLTSGENVIIAIVCIDGQLQVIY
jgi:hypothetical protein